MFASVGMDLDAGFASTARAKNLFMFSSKILIIAICPKSLSTSVIYEYMPVSLAEISGPELCDRSVAAVLIQVLQGLAYIHKNKLTCFDLKSRNVLIDFKGTVKLWPTEFGERHLNLAHDLKALRNLVQALMQGYESDPPKIDDRSRWGEGCLMFFDTLITAESLDELPEGWAKPISIRR
ncbi:hypothetical protein NM208_g932 [Fusarium decemcellulare]|uniref:Uncharacterized protein n=1 Tax=Fusarium decemcellulare TaxID=57161 RepID=A0ACC1SYG0_9HYPO|nr:hypothetical protein NM208_g932 [Fusarium decemcellulare]